MIIHSDGLNVETSIRLKEHSEGLGFKSGYPALPVSSLVHPDAEFGAFSFLWNRNFIYKRLSTRFDW